MGGRRKNANPLVPARGWAAGRGWQGGGADVRAVEAGRGKKVPLYRRTPGYDRDLGAGKV